MDYIYLERKNNIIRGFFPTVHSSVVGKLCEMAVEDYNSVSNFCSYGDSQSGWIFEVSLDFQSLKTAHRVCEQISRISGIPCKWNLPSSQLK